MAVFVWDLLLVLFAIYYVIHTAHLIKIQRRLQKNKILERILLQIIQLEQLLPVEPEINRFDIDEYHRVKARLAELEAHPDKEKILAQPRRF